MSSESESERLVYLGAYIEAVFPLKKITTPWKTCPNKACSSNHSDYQVNTKFCCNCGSEVVLIQKETSQKTGAYDIVGYTKFALRGEDSDTKNQVHCWIPKDARNTCISNFNPDDMDDFILPMTGGPEDTEVLRICDQRNSLMALFREDFEHLKKAYAKVGGTVQVRWGLLFWKY